MPLGADTAGLSGLYLLCMLPKGTASIRHSGRVWMCKYSPLSHYHTRRQLPCIHHELWLLGLTFWWKAFLSGLDNGISESSQNSKPMKHPLKVFHRTQATDHPLQFELMHYLSRYAHIVSDVCWKLKLHHKHLNKFTVTTLTCQM